MLFNFPNDCCWAHLGRQVTLDVTPFGGHRKGLFFSHRCSSKQYFRLEIRWNFFFLNIAKVSKIRFVHGNKWKYQWSRLICSLLFVLLGSIDDSFALPKWLNMSIVFQKRICLLMQLEPPILVSVYGSDGGQSKTKESGGVSHHYCHCVTHFGFSVSPSVCPDPGRLAGDTQALCYSSCTFTLSKSMRTCFSLFCVL